MPRHGGSDQRGNIWREGACSCPTPGLGSPGAFLHPALRCWGWGSESPTSGLPSHQLLPTGDPEGGWGAGGEKDRGAPVFLRLSGPCLSLLSTLPALVLPRSGEGPTAAGQPLLGCLEAAVRAFSAERRGPEGLPFLLLALGVVTTFSAAVSAASVFRLYLFLLPTPIKQFPTLNPH